jgi:hypothetical protein
MQRLLGLASRACVRVRSTVRVAAVTVGFVVASVVGAHAQRWTSYGNQFLISRNFSEIVINETDAASASLYIDPIRNVSNDEGGRLRQLVLDSLRDKVRIADTKEHANYWLQILFQDHKYPIRNPNLEFAHGSVVFSVCRYPIKEMSDDCETLTYFYFFDAPNCRHDVGVAGERAAREHEDRARFEAIDLGPEHLGDGRAVDDTVHVGIAVDAGFHLFLLTPIIDERKVKSEWRMANSEWRIASKIGIFLFAIRCSLFA